MIRGVFEFAGEIIEVIIDGNNLYFYDSSGTISTLEGIKFDKQGVIREFPDLKDDDDWKKKAIERLKEKIKSMKNEKETLEYVKNELVAFGNKALYFQIAGFRPKRFS